MMKPTLVLPPKHEPDPPTPDTHPDKNYETNPSRRPLRPLAKLPNDPIPTSPPTRKITKRTQAIPKLRNEPNARIIHPMPSTHLPLPTCRAPNQNATLNIGNPPA